MKQEALSSTEGKRRTPNRGVTQLPYTHELESECVVLNRIQNYTLKKRIRTGLLCDKTSPPASPEGLLKRQVVYPIISMTVMA